MDTLLRRAEQVSDLAAWLAGAALIGISFLIGFDVIVRRFFGFSVQGADEIGGYILAVTGAWAISLTLLRRAHIRIDSVSRMFPVRARAVLDVLGMASLAAFMAIMTTRVWTVLLQSIESSSRSMTPLGVPLAIPQSIWVLGFCFFLAVILLLLAKSIVALARGEIETVGRLIGSRSVVEEIAAEMEPGREAPD